MSNHEVIFSTPPPSRWGASTSGDMDWFYDALLVNPGRWAELPPRNGTRWSLSAARRKQGFTSATRKLEDGTRKIWIIFNPPAEVS